MVSKSFWPPSSLVCLTLASSPPLVGSSVHWPGPSPLRLRLFSHLWLCPFSSYMGGLVRCSLTRLPGVCARARFLTPPLEPRIGQSQSICHRPSPILSSPLSRSRNGTSSLLIGLRKLGQGSHVRSPSAWGGQRTWTSGQSSDLLALLAPSKPYHWLEPGQEWARIILHHPPLPLWGGQGTALSHAVLFSWYPLSFQYRTVSPRFEFPPYDSSRLGEYYKCLSPSLYPPTSRGSWVSPRAICLHTVPGLSFLWALYYPGPRHGLPHEALLASMSSGVFLLNSVRVKTTYLPVSVTSTGSNVSSSYCHKLATQILVRALLPRRVRRTR